MCVRGLVVSLLLGLVVPGSPVSAQVLTPVSSFLIVPDDGTLGIQVTCTGCDEAGVVEVMTATSDDTNYATIEPSETTVGGDPFVTVFNVKGENEGGTILRFSVMKEGGTVVAEATVTVQVISEFDDDCIFDDVTAGEPNRESILFALRQYRDVVLAANHMGRQYSEWYYRHSPELIQIMAADAELREDVLYLLHAHHADLLSILRGKSIALTTMEVAYLDSVLARFQHQATWLLGRTIEELRFDLQNGRKLRTLGFRVQRVR